MNEPVPRPPVAFAHQELQAILFDWPRISPPQEPVQDGVLERIRQILCHTSPARLRYDLPPLIRQHLLRESARAGGTRNLRVPSNAHWPDQAGWEEHSVSAMPAGENAYLLSAAVWSPDWLGSGTQGAFADAFSGRSVRREARCAADPFVADATGYQYYACPGQREAIRAAFLMQPGHTLLINLPTGSGKSLVGQIPTLVNKQEGNLTLFVVPTVALAIDQARQMSRYLQHQHPTERLWPLAWYGGMPTEDRADIRRRLETGRQRILFTSPEALTTSLLKAVLKIAHAGMLQYLVIDEAHLITQWGDDFRPAFQALAGLRNALLTQAASAGLRTLLLSATFTADTVETLGNLFGPKERVHMISAVHLRPEPQYWFYRADSSAEKRECVLEAIKHAPRPFILYLTRQKDAVEWHSLLRERLGLSRVACFHGNTPDKDRRSILQRWVTNDLDGIVATSAFGVGIDKSDVRAVIHATIPETLDRFYQEVGRGGRDGKASISLLIHDRTDWALPRQLSKRRIISDELGLNRWRALYQSRKEETDGAFAVDIDAVPEHGKSGNEYNVGWNMRTLLLMSRAGLIALDIQANEEAAQNNDISEYSPSSPLAAMSRIRVRILNHGHLLSTVWEEHVSPCRTEAYRSSIANLVLLKALLTDHREVAATLAQLYRIASVRWPVQVIETCGGCPADRFSDDDHRIDYRVPIAVPLHEIVSYEMHAWTAHFPWLNPAFVMVFYEDQPTQAAHAAITSFLNWLVGECRFQEIATRENSALARTAAFRALYKKRTDRVLIHRNNSPSEEPYSPLPRISILEGPIASADLWQMRTLQRPFHIVLVPASTPDPDNDSRLLSDTTMNSARLDQLLPVLLQ
jgi:ATP-dependent DNA helicase RecQ